MSITFECQDCGARYKTKEENIGRKTKCKNCEAVVVIQDASAKQPRPNRPKTQVITRTDLKPKTKAIQTGDAERPKTRSTKVSERPASQASARPATKSVKRPESKSGEAARPATKTIKRPESRVASKVMKPESGKPKMSPMARAKARHKTLNKDSIAKLSKAGNIGAVKLDRAKVKEAGSHHESHLDRLKTDKASKKRGLIFGAVALVFVALGAVGVFYGMQPDEEVARNILDKSQEIVPLPVDGGEWWCNGWHDAVEGQWAVYGRGGAGGGDSKELVDRYTVSNRDTENALVHFKIQTLIENEPTSEAADSEMTIDPDRAKARFLATASDYPFQVTKIEENQTYKIGDKEFTGCVKVTKVIGKDLNEIKREDVIFFSPEVPCGHIVAHLTRDPSVSDRWKKQQELRALGGPDIDRDLFSKPRAGASIGFQDTPAPADDAGDDSGTPADGE